MKTKTKYNIGQTVYTIRNNDALEKHTIKEIHIAVKEKFNEHSLGIDDQEILTKYVFHDSTKTSFKESEIFSNLGEAIELIIEKIPEFKKQLVTETETCKGVNESFTSFKTFTVYK